MAAATLHVLPNPYAALDADGNPAGAFPDETAPGSYHGARLVLEGADIDPRLLLGGRAGSPKRRFVFDDVDVLTVPATPHYVYALRTRELLPADEATARECGLKFVPIEDALSTAKAEACKRHKAETGRAPACETEPLAGLSVAQAAGGNQ